MKGFRIDYIMIRRQQQERRQDVFVMNLKVCTCRYMVNSLHSAHMVCSDKKGSAEGALSLSVVSVDTFFQAVVKLNALNC